MEKISSKRRYNIKRMEISYSFMKMFKHLLIQFALGILAGLAIGLGGFLFVLLKTFVPGEYGKILSSIIFAVGLFLVCFFGLSLYTGKIGLVFEEKKELKFYLSLPVMIIGNAIGAIGLGFICYLIFKDTDLFTTAVNATTSRTAQFDDIKSFEPFLATLIKGAACGLCVYFAVKSYAFGKIKNGGVILLVFFVFLFVYFGFEHCIANMFYFSMANMWTAGAFINIGLVILANSIGTIPGVFCLKLAQKVVNK